MENRDDDALPDEGAEQPDERVEPLAEHPAEQVEEPTKQVDHPAEQVDHPAEQAEQPAEQAKVRTELPAAASAPSSWRELPADVELAADSRVPTPYAETMDTLAQVIDAIVDTDRLIASAMAWRAGLIDGARRIVESTEIPDAAPDGDPVPWSAAERARRLVTAELAVALKLPEQSAARLLVESRMLAEHLPATLAALRSGETSYRHVQRIVDHALSLPADARQDFEEAVLPTAVTRSVTQLDRRARRVRERMHPASITERHRAAVEDRCVLREPARDGMAWLHLFLAADRIEAAFDRIDAAARADIPDDGLDSATTLAQRRADVATELLLGGGGSRSRLAGEGRSAAGGRRGSASVDDGVRATVHVTVPVLTLMGHDDAPADLAGYGPIDAETARRLAGTATSWTRILTHPITGTVLDVDRGSYAVPKDLRRYLQVRDETCRFPNCNRAADRCDVDHSIDWGLDGKTAHDNLAHLCRPHHRLKHQTGWTIEHLGRADLRWTSPTGKQYITEPATVMRR